MLAGAVDKLLTTHPNPDQQAALLIAAGMYEWFRFGEREDQLPLGLVKVVDDNTKAVCVCYDRSLIAEQDVEYTWAAIEEMAGRPLTGQFPDSLRWQLDEYRSTLAQVVEQTEGHQLVQSLLTDPPVREHPQPLTPWQRTAREAQIDAEVRWRYGIPEREPIPPRSPADYARRRALYHLDDETTPRRQRELSPDDAVVIKLRRFFGTHVLAALRASANPNAADKLRSYRYGGDNYLGYATAAPGGLDDNSAHIEIDDFDYLSNFADTLRHPCGYDLNQPFEANHLEQICNEVHDESLRDADLPDSLRDAMEHTAHWASVRLYLSSQSGHRLRSRSSCSISSADGSPQPRARPGQARLWPLRAMA